MKQLLGGRIELLAVDGVKETRSGGTVQGDVLCRGKVRAQRQFLVNHADPHRTGMMRIFKPDFFAVNEDFTGVWLELSGKNVNQRAFAGAVFAQERMNLAGMQDKVHPVQR